MILSELLRGVSFDYCSASPDDDISGIADDSRSVRPGYMFVAVRGSSEDGHAYITPALAAGASCIVAEDIRIIPGDVSAVKVADSRKALIQLASNFFRIRPANMILIGVTGTNGKTTTAYLIESVIASAGFISGVIGTVNYRYPGKIVRGSNTTPDPIVLASLLRDMADTGVTHAVMEVSSHALDQRRVDGCPFRIAVFTNLSRDHLDYHDSMDSYFKAKTRLFQEFEYAGGLPPYAAINADDRRGKELIGMLEKSRRTGVESGIITFGLSEGCMVRPRSHSIGIEGIRALISTPACELEIESSLIGRFNLYNILAAVSACIAGGIDPVSIAAGIRKLKGVPGRLEKVETKLPAPVLVDYAHSPDALFNVLDTLRPLTSGRIITVFGCGGDRDKGKRPQMGAIAARMSDVVVITSDNPRTEDPLAIARRIEEGVVEAGMRPFNLCEPSGTQTSFSGSGYMMEIDRAAAIKKALGIAESGDIVLIAGKGHEDYQIIGGVKRHFDDREAVLAATGDIK